MKYAIGERVRCFAAAHKAGGYPPNAEGWIVVRYLPRTGKLSARYVLTHEEVEVFARSIFTTTGGRS